MKKKPLTFIILIFCFLLLIIAADQQRDKNNLEIGAEIPLNQTATEVIGDVNEDGLVSLQDALLTDLMASGKLEASPLADLNGDDTVSKEDVELLLQMLGEELLFNSFDKKQETNIQESWEQYNKAYSLFIKDLQADSSKSHKTKQRMEHYLDAYYRYVYSIGNQFSQKGATQQEK
jgi:hypothetical protein